MVTEARSWNNKRAAVPRGKCKLCKRDLYPDQPVVWLTSPMGLSHQDCVPSAS